MTESENKNEQTICSENISSDENISEKTAVTFNEAKDFNTLFNYSMQVGDDELFKHLTFVQK